MTRKIGLALLVAGGLLLAWVGVTVTWGDPLTSLYTRHEQHVLAGRLDALEQEWEGTRAPSRRTVLPAATLRARAVRFERTVRDGGPVGRIAIPRLGLRMVVVEGTSERDLEKGPGHYDERSGRATAFPGQGEVIAIAGHRTTFLHPFLHIDRLRAGDAVTLVMPYGTFTYVVTGHRVVASDDWSILRRGRGERLVLTACHPPHSASHRWVVFARLARAVAI